MVSKNDLLALLASKGTRSKKQKATIEEINQIRKKLEEEELSDRESNQLSSQLIEIYEILLKESPS